MTVSQVWFRLRSRTPDDSENRLLGKMHAVLHGVIGCNSVTFSVFFGFKHHRPRLRGRYVSRKASSSIREKIIARGVTKFLTKADDLRSQTCAANGPGQQGDNLARPASWNVDSSSASKQAGRSNRVQSIGKCGCIFAKRAKDDGSKDASETCLRLREAVRDPPPIAPMKLNAVLPQPPPHLYRVVLILPHDLGVLHDGLRSVNKRHWAAHEDDWEFIYSF